jgi:hypothetical protein
MNSSISIIIFTVLTLLYSIITNFIPENGIFPMTIIYYALTITTQFYFIYNMSKTTCGSVQLGDVFIWGFIPWFVIFGTLTILLRVFPGWKAPFSNTFGYMVVSLMGVKSVLNSVLKSNFSSGNPGLNKIAEDIFEDNSLFINQFTPINFNTAIQKIKPLIDMNALETSFRGTNFINDPKIQKLRKMVEVKDSISTMMWYLLTGILTISVATMGILSSKCNKTAKQLKSEKNTYNKKLKEKAKEESSKIKTKYFIRD